MSKDVIALRVNIGREIGITKITLRSLGNPANIHFWRSANNEYLAINASDESTDLSVKIPDNYYSRRAGFNIFSSKLRRAIKSFSGFDDTSNYYLIGEYVPEYNIVIFKLRDAHKTGVGLERRISQYAKY
jgi:hypothetical protein